MRIPTGATGFGAAQPIHVVPARDFMALCHTVARTTSTELVEHVAANAGGDCRSYHRALLSTAEPTWVLCNPYVPAIAFARSVQDPADITYVDDDELARAFEAVSMVQVLTVFDLDCELSRADTSALEPGELRQVAYWQPATVGALLFNFWD